MGWGGMNLIGWDGMGQEVDRRGKGGGGNMVYLMCWIRQAWMMAVDGVATGLCMSSLPYLLT